MRVKFAEQSLAYTGKELRSLFIFHKFNLQGNALVAFAGPCKVALKNMVDQADVKARAPIFSKRMLHFLGEFFGEGLETTILRQRLLMACILDALRLEAPRFVWRREGDDIYLERKKVSVSIATASPVSNLIHAGLNIVSEGTPVSAFGLKEAGILPKKLALTVLERFRDETESAASARCKVRAVP